MVAAAVQRSARPTLVVPSDIEAMAYGLVGEPKDVHEELDRVQQHVHVLYQMEPDMCLRVVAAYSSRLTELSRLLFRLEVTDRKYARIRTMDVQPLLDELDRQHKIASRLLEARAQDMSLEGIKR